MSYTAKHPAAFINALSEGPKTDILEWLQRTWDDYVDAETRIKELEDELSPGGLLIHEIPPDERV